MSYLEVSRGLNFAHHRPYAIKHHIEASTWEDAKAQAERIHLDFKRQLREDEKED